MSDPTPLWERHWVDVSAFSLPASPPDIPIRDVFSLAGEGQAAYIEAIAGKTQDVTNMARALVGPLRRESQPESNRDLGVVKRRVVFSIANRSMSPADRLASVRLTLQPYHGVRLLNWDKLATAYETIDIGTLSFTQKSATGGELAATFGPVSPTITGSIEAGIAEQLTLRERLVSLTGTLSPTEATLLQHSTAGRDLTGNTIVDIEMDLPTQAAKVLTFVSFPAAAGGKIECAQLPSFRFQSVEVPRNVHGGIQARVIVEYVVRRVSQGHVSIYEGDDVVHHIHAVDTIPNVTLIPEADLRVLTWELWAPDSTALTIEQVGPVTGRQSLQFGSYESAIRLRDWIATCGVGSLTDYTFLLGEELIESGSKPNLSVTPLVLNPPSQVQVSSTILQSYVGEYTLAPTETVVVTLENGTLYTQVTGQQKLSLTPLSQVRFSLPMPNSYVTFTKNGSGTVTGLILHLNSSDQPAIKVK